LIGQSTPTQNTFIFQGPGATGLGGFYAGYASAAVTVDVYFDDAIFMRATGDADVANCVMPPFAANRVSGVYMSGPGATQQWTGDWRNVQDKPYTTSPATLQTSASAGLVTSFAHPTAQQLGLGQIHAVAILPNMGGGVGNGSSASALWNGDSYPVKAPQLQTTDINTLRAQPGVGWIAAPQIFQQISHSAFDNSELGIRNESGASLTLAQLWMEVLHDGANPATPTSRSNGSGSWKHKVGSFTGNGGFNAITGIGFRPSFVIVKLAQQGSGLGAVKTRDNGGSSSHQIGVLAPNGALILSFDEDGFTVGPDGQVNKNGNVYIYIAIQDGGLGADGPYMECGHYLGSGTAGQTVDVGFQPILTLIFGAFTGGTVVWRDDQHSSTDCMTVGSSTTVANLITAFVANGFVIGTGTGINARGQWSPFISFRRANELFDGVFAFDTFTAISGVQTVSGLPFTTGFVLADRPTTGDGAFRVPTTLAPAHTGAFSSNWGGGFLTSTAFTALAPTGFTTGAQLTVSGQTTRWMALLGDAGELPAMSTNEHNDPPTGQFEDLCRTKEEPMIFASVAPPGGRNWYAQLDMPDGSEYYGGWKEDRLLSLSDVRRALSGPQLDYEIGSFQVELADDDYAMRSLLASNPSAFYSRWELDAYMITPSGRRNFMTPLKLATGLVDTDPEFDTRDQAMTVRVSCRDRLGVAMGWTSTGQSKLPRRVLNQTTLPGVASTMDGKGAPLPWGLLSSNIVVPSGFSAPTPNGIAARGSFVEGGVFWVAGYAPWNQSIAPVTNLSAIGVAGGDCPERTYAVQVFPVGTGERVGDPTPYVNGDVQVAITSPNQIIEVSWDPSPDAIRYYVVLSAFYFGWRQQQVITTTGTTVQFNHAFDTPSPGTGFADGATAVAPTGVRYYSARSKNGPIVSNWHEVENPSLYPEQTGFSFALPNGAIRPIRIYWNPATGAAAYQIKKRAAGPFTPLLFNSSNATIEGGLFYWDDDWNDAEALTGDPVPERASGRVKAHYVRDVQLPDGDTWQELIIAGAAIKQVDDWYYDPGGDSSNVQVNQGDGTDFVFPKPGTAWDSMFTTRYRDIQGTDGIPRRYTMAYARGEKGRLIASGISMITVNLQGIEDVGDGTGDVITDLHDQTLHELNYFVVASGEGYTSGLWGAVPRQGYEDLPVVDDESFVRVRTMRENEITGGYVAAGITGANGELIDVSTWLKRRCVSGDFRLGPNRFWQISCHAINEFLSPLFITEELTDEFDIHRRTFKPQPRLSELQNVFAYRYNRNYVLNNWDIDGQVVRDETSIEHWNLVKQGEDLEFHYVTDAGVAEQVLSKHMHRRVNAPMYVPLEGGLCLLSEEYDVGRYFKLKHWRGVQVGGWVDRVMWVVANTFMPSTKRVRLECLDVTSLLGSEVTNALLEEQMDIDLGGSWYNKPVDIVSQNAVQIVTEAYEYRDRRVAWAKFPIGTTTTARFYGRVVPGSGITPGSGTSLTLSLYDPDNDVIIATDPTPFVSATFALHTFQIPTSPINKQYRLRATVTVPSGYAGEVPVQFNGVLRTDLP
jgi:hypothetical protein